jgi:hypothetical protein
MGDRGHLPRILFQRSAEGAGVATHQLSLLGCDAGSPLRMVESVPVGG